MTPLSRFILLYAAMYASYGVASPFLPAFVNERGVAPELLGLVLGAGTTMRLLSAPLAGRIADALHALRKTLVVCIALAAVITFAYLPAYGFAAFLLITLLHAAALAPMTMLADALALGASKRHGYEYGWVRGTGSAGFIIAALVAGQLVAAHGLDTIVWLQASLLALAALAAFFIPEIPHSPALARPSGGVATLLRVPVYRTMVVIAALVLGSHALHDGFAVIRWRAAGIAPGTVSLLWVEAVAAEVLIFFVLGPRLVHLLRPAGALALAALAGVARWSVMALTVDVSLLALVQPLHGVTFALLHLACMRLIARIVPSGLEGTAQALYGTGIGTASALVMLASGSLYGQLGGEAFWIMATLCAIALPLALRLARLSPLH
ncbi:MAG TPA: MFS transporter [Burkholderiales bacterium]|nr:MFS transporter [Burkholderiales bacterium]